MDDTSTSNEINTPHRFALYRKDTWVPFNEQELVEDMPASLKADVVTFVQRNTIARIPWLQTKDRAFVADFVVLLKPRFFRVSVCYFLVKARTIVTMMSRVRCLLPLLVSIAVGTYHSAINADILCCLLR